MVASVQKYKAYNMQESFSGDRYVLSPDCWN